MKLKELIRDLEIVETRANLDLEISGISYDSRKTVPGDLFIAVCGFETDGHRFIPLAVEKGAVAVLCERVPDQDIPYVCVKDSRLALALSSCVFFGNPSSSMRMIGITGTSGKTSVSILLKQVLEKTLSAKVGLIGTNGIYIGDTVLPADHTTPESYELQRLFRRMADEGCSHVVMEVSSHALELNRVAGVRFHTAVYTNLSQDHLDFHGDMEHYAAAKRRLFTQCDEACINTNDDWAEFMVRDSACPVLRYGTDDTALLKAENLQMLPDHVCFDALFHGERVKTKLGIPGSFSVFNALAVMAAAYLEGVPLLRCAEALAVAKGVAGRLENVPTNREFSILIDYSHKPDALEKVLKSLRPATRGRLICLFGCGGDRDRIKRPIMGRIAGKLADIVILTSDNPRTEDPEMILDEIEQGLSGLDTPYERICDRTEAIGRAIELAKAGDVILLAGKGHEDYQIVGHAKRHMDEREIVAHYLNIGKAVEIR